MNGFTGATDSNAIHAGATSITISGSNTLQAGEFIKIGQVATGKAAPEVRKVITVAGAQVTLDASLVGAHDASSPVVEVNVPLYIDVTFAPATGTTLDYSSIYAASQVTVTPSGGSAFALNTPVALAMTTDPNTGAQVPVGIKLANPTALTADDLTALQNAAVTRFRYDFTDPSTTLPAGDITIAFAGTWLDSMGDAPGAGSATVHVAGPTGVLVTAAGGSGIDINSLNGRTYLDVTVPAAPTGFATDWGAMGQRTVLFTLSGPGVGTAKLDTSQAPLVDTGAGTIRYWITGSFGTGAVVLNWVTGAPALKATVIANVTSSGLVNQGAATIDVLFPSVPTGDKVVSSSLDFTEFTLGGTGIGTGATQLQINSGVRPQVLADGKTVRYYVAGVPTDESQVSATFVGGTHTFDVVPVIGGSTQTMRSSPAIAANRCLL